MRTKRQLVPCHVKGCLDHVQGCHVDYLGDSIWHGGCDACATASYSTAYHWPGARRVHTVDPIEVFILALMTVVALSAVLYLLGVTR
jgi:uncharacterized protein YraI